MNALRRHPRWAAAAVIAAFVAASHAWCIGTGLFLDDHTHYQQLREISPDQSLYEGLVDAARLGLFGKVMKVWAFRDEGLNFYRPVAFGLMRLAYVVGGWRPAAAHVASLVWHFAACLLVAELTWRSLGRWLPAGLAGLILAVHPAHVLSVQWIACQTELIVTTLLLAATLCYSHWSGWRRPWFGGSGWGAGGDPHGRTRTATDERGRAISTQGSPGWLVLALVLFAAAMGCRENALVWPAIVALGDGLLRRQRLRGRWWVYATAAGMIGGYWLVRHAAMSGLPPAPASYFIRPIVPHLLMKTGYYLMGLIPCVPVLPFGGLQYFKSHPWWFAAGVVFSLGLLAEIAWRHRRSRGLWLWMGWLFAAMAPVLPIFASPHHLYLPGVAISVLLAASWWGLLARDGAARPSRRRWWLVGLGAGLHVGLMAAGAFGSGWVYRICVQTEHQFVDNVVTLTRDPPLKDDDKLFFINLPVLAYHAVPAIEQATGLENLEGYVLTISPHLLLMDEPCEVRQLDERRLRVSLWRDGYFSGTLGRQLSAAMDDPDLSEGKTIRGRHVDGEFSVHIDRAGPEGIRSLTFTFRKPLNSPDSHFYLGSRLFLAYPLDFE